MCDPSLGVAAASMALGTMSQQNAVKSQVNARNKAMEANARKQAEYQAQADVVNKNTNANFTKENQDALRQANVEKAVANNSNVGEVGDFTTNTSIAPVEVKSEIARKIADAVSAGKNYVKTSANMNSYGQTNFDNTLALAKGAEDVGRISNFSQGESAILPLALQEASQKGQGSMLAADIFNGVGSMAAMYGVGQLGKGNISDLYTIKGANAGSAAGINVANPNIGTGIKLGNPQIGTGVKFNI